MTVRKAIRAVVAGKSLNEEEAYRVACAVMAGEATPAQIGGLLVGFRMKGEVADELLGFVRAVRFHMTSVCVPQDRLVDTCGTGGDLAGTFNISTVAAFVAAGAGCRVAKHGNRSISSRCGSADVLHALGVRIDLPVEQSTQCIEKIGIGFLFAPLFHKSLRYAVGPRHEIGVRSILNIIGPLANPAGARRQLIGVFEGSLTESMAVVLAQLGCHHCLVVHGDDGLDEITVTGPTRVTEFRDGRTQTYTIRPEEFGLCPAKLEDLRGGDAKTNADIAVGILSGVRGPARDVVLLNAAGAIYVSGRCQSLNDGIALAAESIDSGLAIEKLHALRQCTREGP